jgi:hypothetical protein
VEEAVRGAARGDRFFYLNDPLLGDIQRHYGIDYRHTLADIIHLNTNVIVRQDVFKIPRSGSGG